MMYELLLPFALKYLEEYSLLFKQYSAGYAIFLNCFRILRKFKLSTNVSLNAGGL